MPEPYEYPTDDDLARVQAWECVNGLAPWFDYVKSLWWCADWGWREYDGIEDGNPVHVYQVSTGGWSGNESLIEAMRGNRLGWLSSFYQHRRGGHFEFRRGPR